MQIARWMVALVVAGVQASAIAANAERGADLFDTHCSDCHSVAAKIANRKGPSLHGVVGRKAGTVEGAKYSAAMTASGIVWTVQNLDSYIANPKGPVPMGTMKFKGLPKAEDRADLIAYLGSQK
jgi:cytochrome c